MGQTKLFSLSSAQNLSLIRIIYMNPFYLGMITSIPILAILGFVLLAKKGPPLSVLALGGIIWTMGMLVQPGQIRELNLLVGVLRLTGCIGVVIGIVLFFRRRKQIAKTPTPKNKSSHDSTRPCPNCGRVNSIQTKICPRCEKHIDGVSDIRRQ